ncbi:PaaI family thioesterase [Phanerochaete sordida]|uniref:PaaI family thioesterase n=1 Tax=Phanerochaete sordida TaxID=48140 RepID=A0A9P3GLG8_9APHY|nr:PaaI family thioesterase [Phanerochaete sordida]
MDTLERSFRNAPGNVPQELKDLEADWWARDREMGQSFARGIMSRLQVTEANILEDASLPGRREARLVFEIDVTPDMCNALQAMHGGCTATFVDVCTFMARNLVPTNADPVMTVSLALNVVYHAPAPLGSRLRIICSSVSKGSRVITSRAEIYDVTHGRIVASGTHIKVPPSQPKL